MIDTVRRRYYLLAVLHICGANMTAAVLMIYLKSMGLSEPQAMLAYASYFLVPILMQIPTGAVADTGGRKRAFLISCGVNAVCMLAYAMADNFYWFAFAAAIGGVGAAYANGTLDSWFVGQLNRYGGEAKELDLTFTYAQFFKCLVAGVSGLAGILIAGHSMQPTWIVACVVFVITGIVAWRVMDESDFVRERLVTSREKWRLMCQTAQTGVKQGLDNFRLRFVIVSVTALYAAMMIPNMLWQPHFLQWLPERDDLGWVWLGAQAFTGLGILIVLVLRLWGHEIYDRRTMLLCQFVIAIGIMGTGALSSPVASLAMYYMYQTARGAFMPINVAFLHRHIPSGTVRATVVSIEGGGHDIGSAVGLVLGAGIVYLFSREIALIFAGAFLLVFVALSWKTLRQR